MATSIQTFADRSTFLNDLDLLVLLHILIKVLQEKTGRKEEEERLISWSTDICEGYGPGTIDLQLDDFAQDRKLTLAFLEALTCVEKRVRSVGASYPSRELITGWLTDGVIPSDYDPQLILDALAELRDLIIPVPRLPSE
jgi:hypothetical protein